MQYTVTTVFLERFWRDLPKLIYGRGQYGLRHKILVRVWVKVKEGGELQILSPLTFNEISQRRYRLR